MKNKIKSKKMKNFSFQKHYFFKKSLKIKKHSKICVFLKGIIVFFLDNLKNFFFIEVNNNNKI